MTTNEKIDSVIRPNECFHNPCRIPDAYAVDGSFCTICQKESPSDLSNPNYETPDGIQEIKAWLIKEGKWEEFKQFTWNICVKKSDYDNSAHEHYFDIATDPTAFCEKFIEYCEKERLI